VYFVGFCQAPDPPVSFKYSLRSSVRHYLSEAQALAGDNLVSTGHSSIFAAAETMTTGLGSGNGSGKEKDKEVSMG
jgi:hypothetical protein